MIYTPTFALVDSAAFDSCGRRPDSRLPQDLRQLFSLGIAVPFLTQHQMMEIAQHNDQGVYQSRMAYLGGLAAIASCPDFISGTGIGSILDLREQEMRHILEHSEATHDEIIRAIKPSIRGLFHTGSEFVTLTKDGLSEFRKGLHRHAVELKAEIASMDHFPLVDYSTPLEVSESGVSDWSRESLARWLEHEMNPLREKIARFGDKRVSNPDGLLKREFSDYPDIVEKLARDERGFATALCDSFGIRKERLPKNPTIGDAGMEAIFVANIGLHGQRMGIDPATLLQKVRKEQLPSWVIWEGLLRKMRTADETTGSNLHDRHLASFGPYVDVLHVDKRTKGFLKELAQGRDVPHQELFQQVFQKAPRRNGLEGLVEAIREQVPPSPPG